MELCSLGDICLGAQCYWWVGAGSLIWVCLTSLLMMLEATVNSNLVASTDDSKSGGVINISKGRALERLEK